MNRIGLLVAILLLSAEVPALAQKPPASPPDWDPVFVYEVINGRQSGALAVADETGANQLIIFGGKGRTGRSSNKSPSWSPLGDSIVFASDFQGNGVYIIDKFGLTAPCKIVSTNLPPNLNPGQAEPGNISPVWSPVPLPVGSATATYKILYSDIDATTGARDLYVVDAPLAGECPATPLPVGNRVTGTTLALTKQRPAWSKDGSHIAYDDNGSSPPHTHVADIDVSGSSPVLSNDRILGTALPTRAFVAPNWARTQDTLVVMSFTLSLDLWFMDPLTQPEPDPTPFFETATTDELWPAWSPNVAEIGFVRPEVNVGFTLYKRDVSTGVETPVIAPSRIGQPYDFDWRR